MNDSSCPIGQTAYATFRVIVVPPAPVLNPTGTPNTGFTLAGGVPTLTFGTVAWFRHRVVYTDEVANRLSTWLPLITAVTDPGGWVFVTGSCTTISDTAPLVTKRFDRVEVSAP